MEATRCERIRQSGISRAWRTLANVPVTTVTWTWPLVRSPHRDAHSLRRYAQALRASKAGASGYLLKNMIRMDLVETIGCVRAGQRRFLARWRPSWPRMSWTTHCPSANSKSSNSLPQATRTGVSRSVVRVGGHGQGTHENIMSKLDANDWTHAVTIALKRGIIEM